MKRILFIFSVVLAVVATSCMKEKDSFVPETGLVEVSLNASMEQEDGVARATEEDGVFAWSADDAVSVLVNSGCFRKFEVDDESHGKAEAVLTGLVDPDEEVAHYAVYPHSDHHDYGESALTVHLPSEYGSLEEEYVENTNVVMLAEIEDNDLMFNHLAGVLNIRITKMPAGAAKLKFTANTGITGSFPVEEVEGEKVIKAAEPSEGNNSVTVNFKPLGKQAENEMSFYIPLPVGTYEGFSITVLDKDGNELWNRTTDKTNAIARRTFARLPVLEGNVIEIRDAEGLKSFFASSKKNITVRLTDHIDLSGDDWTPVNSWEGAFNGLVFDGAGHSIRNMKVVGYASGGAYGFFSSNASSMTIRNLTFENALVDSRGGNTVYSGVLMGKNYSSVTIENVHVKNSIVTNNWQCGGFVGFAETNAPAFTECSISDSFVGGFNATAGTLFGLGAVDVIFDRCGAANVELYTDTDNSGCDYFAGHLYGKNATVTDSEISNVTIVSVYPESLQ